MAVSGHGGNDAEKVAGTQDISALLIDYRNLFAHTDFTAPYDIEVRGVGFAFNDDVGTLLESYDGKL
jgi:hypothetical protein